MEGLKAFRQTEYEALRQHERSRAGAMEKKREDRTHTPDLFAGYQAGVQEATIDEIVSQQQAAASTELLKSLALHGPHRFSSVVSSLLQAYMLRETNVKDICVALVRAGRIENTWGGGNRKPRSDDLIKLKRGTG